MARRKVKRASVTRVKKILYVFPCVLLTASCVGSPYELFHPEDPSLIDPSMQLDRKDYQNLTDPAYNAGEKALSAELMEPPIPDLAEILAAPKPPKLGETKLVSIAVTDDVPLKDVLVELARLATVDIEIDAGITGGISFRAKDRPFNEVIERIADLASLRYSMKDGILRVERDTPYVQIYSLDFLNLNRSSESNVNVSTSVLSTTVGGGGGGETGGAGGGTTGGGGATGGSSGGGGAGGLSNGSSSSVTAKADSDFWAQFEESVKRILTYREPRRTSDIRIAEQPGAPPPPPPVGPDGAPLPAAAAPVIVAPAPVTEEIISNKPLPNSFYIINREASTMTVSATDRQHTLIKEFLRRIQTNASAQVLIEAKIVEVTLSDQFQSGIDWRRLGGDEFNFTSAFGGVTDPTNIATFTLKPNNDLSSAVELIQNFGTTRTLSSPRLHAINNQQAVLTFAENQVYFRLTIQNNTSTSTTGSTNTLTVNSTPHTVPIGIILALQPSVNMETNEVTLSVRPTLSRITGEVSDPAVAFALAEAADAGIDITGISSTLPIIEVRELDSILKLKSGQVMVIGGLMQDKATNNDSGLPYVSQVPVFGSLFQGTSKLSELSELVIFIRATIVNTNGSADPADKSLYHKFTKDPRPVQF